MNKEYQLFIPTLYRNSVNVYSFELERALAELNLNALWGFADSTGVIISFQFESIIAGFKNASAIVELKGELFSIDETRKRIEGTTTVL